MNKHTLILALVVIAALSACRKLEEPIEGYFYVLEDNSDTYTLYLNKEKIGILPVSDTLASPCDPLTLTNTLYQEMVLKRNKYEVKNSAGDVVSEGKFKVNNNEALSYSLGGKLGHVKVSLHDGKLVMGFNADFPSEGEFSSSDCP